MIGFEVVLPLYYPSDREQCREVVVSPSSYLPCESLLIVQLHLEVDLATMRTGSRDFRFEGLDSPIKTADDTMEYLNSIFADTRSAEGNTDDSEDDMLDDENEYDYNDDLGWGDFYDNDSIGWGIDDDLTYGGVPLGAFSESMQNHLLSL